MTLFSYDHKWIPGWSPHSFAVFYKLDKESEIKEKFTISWLPKEGPGAVSLFSGTVEGKNYSLEETLNYAFSNDLEVKLSGTFEVKDVLFQKAKERKVALEGGTIKYEVLNNKRRGNNLVLHCVHAISDILANKKLMDTGWAYAESANKKIVLQFKDFIKPSNEKFPWDKLYTSTHYSKTLVKQ